MRVAIFGGALPDPAGVCPGSLALLLNLIQIKVAPASNGFSVIGDGPFDMTRAAAGSMRYSPDLRPLAWAAFFLRVPTYERAPLKFDSDQCCPGLNLLPCNRDGSSAGRCAS